jgi:predicted O-methyltransferase YrrM
MPWARYRGAKKWGWYLDDGEAWRRLFATDAPVKALEVGAFDGVSANLMLDLLFTHPQSEVHAIDPYLPDPTTPEVDATTRGCFEENCRIGGHEEQVKLYEGISAEVLAWMASGDGFWQSFDFIFIDGSHLAKDVFIDAALSWNLLKPGGILAFDDYTWSGTDPNPLATPRPAIDAFASVFSDRMELIRGGSRRIFRKTEGL